MATVSTSWLADSTAIRAVLVEVGVYSGGSETTRYLSSKGYTTQSTDTPSNTVYLPIILNGVSTEESIDLENEAPTSLRFSSITLSNLDGRFDSWLDDIWTNRSIKIYVGDVRWSRSSFVEVFSGVVLDIQPSGKNSLSLSIVDKLQRLNAPITEVTTTIVSSGSFSDPIILPLTFGEVFNVSPIEVDPPNHVYQVHQGPIESIIEVRDGGVPLVGTALPNYNIAQGKFTLTGTPAQAVTCSIQGEKVSGSYLTTAASIIERIVTAYGKASTAFTAADIDSTTFTYAKNNYTQAVGYYVSEKDNILSIIGSLAYSIGCRLFMDRDGKLKIIKLAIPGSASIVINSSKIVEDSFTVSNKITPIGAIKYGYCKNWTTQEDLQSGIPDSHKRFFEEEYIYVNTNNSTVVSAHKLTTEPKAIDTLLLAKTESETLAGEQLALWSGDRRIVKVRALPTLVNTTVGDSVQIVYNRFGFTNGIYGIVTKMEINWDTLMSDMEVLI